MSAKKRTLVDELHAPARKNFSRRRVVVRGYDDLWEADVVEMRPYARFNKGHNYILTMIDILTKYAWAVPLKTKGGAEVARAIATILLADGRRPTNLHTDRGKEFYNVEMTRLTKKHGINHYSTYSVMKASVVERFNRTLKNAMWKMFSLNGNYKWIDALSRLIAEYNARKHRTIGMRPVDVTPAKARQLLSTVYSNIKIAAPARFKTNDPVRISKYKTIFDKGYTPNWSTEVFRIDRIQRTNPVTYLLRDSLGETIAGGFYEHELQRVNDPNVYLIERVLRKKGTKLFVKWLGMDKSHNPWIDKKALV